MAVRPTKLILIAALLGIQTQPAPAHPHVFAEARLDVVVSSDKGAIDAFRHLWRFDDLFSSTVIMEFDKNSDGKLDNAELESVRQTTYGAMAEYNYFQMVTADGKDVPLSAPDEFVVSFDQNQLIIMFQAKPKAPLKAGGKIDVGIYDPTFYTAIDFVNDGDMALSAMPNGCTSKVVRPDPDEVIAQNQDKLDAAFFNDPAGNDMSKMFATRLELTCPPAQG